MRTGAASASEPMTPTTSSRCSIGCGATDEPSARVHAVRESLEDLFMRAVTEEDGTVASPGGVVERGRGKEGDA